MHNDIHHEDQNDTQTNYRVNQSVRIDAQNSSILDTSGLLHQHANNKDDLYLIVKNNKNIQEDKDFGLGISQFLDQH